MTGVRAGMVLDKGVSLTASENALREESRRAVSERQWDLAFLCFQKLLASVRERRDAASLPSLVEEFARLQELSGDVRAASRTRAYRVHGFR